MKVTFVYPRNKSLGIEYLSTVLKKGGHKTELIFDPCLFDDTFHFHKGLSNIFSFKKIIVNQTLESQPDLIAFSVMSDMYRWAREVAREIKKKSHIPIVFGGIHVSSCPEEVIKENFVDFIVVGEGEGAILDLVNYLENKETNYNIKNVWFKKDDRVIKNDLRNLILNLDELPFPDKDLFFNFIVGDKVVGGKGSYEIITSRGCPYSCSYCYNSHLKNLYKDKGKYLRRRSVENVIEELSFAKFRYKLRDIVFHDNSFTYDIQWLRRFAKEYKDKINLPFCCSVCPSISEEIIFLLESAGCAWVNMGIETTNEKLSKNILRRQFSIEEIKESIVLFRKTKINLSINMIMGIPKQTKEDLLRDIEFINENRPDIVRANWLRYYPKTEIIDVAIKESCLNNSDINGLLKKSQSLYLGGSTYNEYSNKIKYIYYLIPFLPKKLIRFIIKKNLYCYFYYIPFYYFFLIMINNIREKFFQLVGYKKRWVGPLSAEGKIIFYSYYILKKYYLVLKNGLK